MGAIAMVNEIVFVTPSHAELQPRSLRTLVNVSRLGIVVSLSVTMLLLSYLRGKDCNHTGFEPWLLCIIYVPTAIVGFTALRRGSRLSSVGLACFVGVGGMALLFYLDYFNVLVEYERWINRGMP